VRHWCVAQRLAQVAGIRAERSPYTEKDGQRSSNSSREHNRYDLRWRLSILFEDVVDLGLGGVADGRLGDAERNAGVAGDGEVERFALVWRGRSERSNDDRCDDWLLGCQELVG